MTPESIRVCATSFALPGNKAWGELAAIAPLAFGDYGDWPTALRTSDQQPLLWLMFVEDVVPPDAVMATDDPSLDTLLAPILDELSRRLSVATAPTVIAWSTWRAENEIREARFPLAWRLLARRLEDQLYRLAADHSALYLVALDRAFADQGLSTAFDTRNFYAARCRLSREGLGRVAGAAAAIFRRIGQAAKKVLVLDCDNTLWAGVVGEVGISGISLNTDGLGKAFHDFQKVLRRLAKEGTLLALVSKNNESEVWDIFGQHPGMVLKRSDIVAWRINWEEKSKNVAALADELDLGLDSFVFWDDNPLEREKMRLAAPEVTTLELPDDVTQWPQLAERLEFFARFVVTREDRQKSDQYRSRSAFVQERRVVADERSFLRSIAMEPLILDLNDASLSRAEQLTTKTNQYNLRTIRHSATDLIALRNLCGEATFLVQLSDRFGDHGIVGLVIGRPGAGGAAFLDTFLMSCRVLGRHLEAWMLGMVTERLRRSGCRWLLAEFRPSGRNSVAEGFLAANGFTPLTEADPSGGALMELAREMSCEGLLYFADLNNLAIPYLDVFEHVPSAPDRFTTATLS